MLLEIRKQLEQGNSIKQIEKDLKRIGKQRAKEPGKFWGRCDSCNTETVLQEDTGLCGPCCFGEADTFNGNF